MPEKARAFREPRGWSLETTSPFLPVRDNARPVGATELREVLDWTLENVEGWETEDVEGLAVQRLSGSEEGRVVERGRCEVVLDAPIETVLALADDPVERSKWDDVVADSMKKHRSREHAFVSFTFQGFMGLAMEDFLFWDAQQAYDREKMACDARDFWSYVILWQPAAVNWEGLPSHEGPAYVRAVGCARPEQIGGLCHWPGLLA